MTRRAAGLALGAALLAAGVAAGAAAQGIGLPNQSRDKPIEILADHGIEWRQSEQAYIAHGNARAIQGDVAVHADTLTAYYRKAEPGRKQPAGNSVTATKGGNQIVRIDADGHVRIVSPNQTAYGDKAVYDVGHAILVLTGRPRMVTATERITASRTLEFWEKRSLAVARGNATVVRADKRLRADILTAHFGKDARGKAELTRIDAHNNVLISSPTEIVRADTGVYDVKTGIVVVRGSVKITRGEDQLNGQVAEVNLKTGVSRMLSGPGTRVEGLFQPGEGAPGRGSSSDRPSRGQ